MRNLLHRFDRGDPQVGDGKTVTADVRIDISGDVLVVSEYIPGVIGLGFFHEIEDGGHPLAIDVSPNLVLLRDVVRFIALRRPMGGGVHFEDSASRTARTGASSTSKQQMCPAASERSTPILAFPDR